MHDIELRNCEEIFLGNLSLDEGKISVGLLVLNSHVKTKNSPKIHPVKQIAEFDKILLCLANLHNFHNLMKFCEIRHIRQNC